MMALGPGSFPLKKALNRARLQKDVEFVDYTLDGQAFAQTVTMDHIDAAMQSSESRFVRASRDKE